MRLLACLALFSLALTSCDSGGADEDLFLLPELTSRDVFNAPRDSLRILPAQAVEYAYVIPGSLAAGTPTALASTAPLDIAGYLASQGYAPEDVRELEVLPTVSVRVVSGAENLSFLYRATAEFVVPDGSIRFGFRNDATAFNGVEADLSENGTGLPVANASSPISNPLRSRLLITATRAVTGPIELRVRFSIRATVKVNVAAGPISIAGEPVDVRDFLQDNDFDIGDVERARYVSVQLQPANAAVFNDRVERVTIQASTTNGEGTSITLARLTEFGGVVSIDADVASIIRRTGQLRLTALLETGGGNQVGEGQLSFTLLSKLQIEVPQPSTIGT